MSYHTGAFAIVVTVTFYGVNMVYHVLAFGNPFENHLSKVKTPSAVTPIQGDWNVVLVLIHRLI